MLPANKTMWIAKIKPYCALLCFFFLKKRNSPTSTVLKSSFAEYIIYYIWFIFGFTWLDCMWDALEVVQFLSGSCLWGFIDRYTVRHSFEGRRRDDVSRGDTLCAPMTVWSIGERKYPVSLDDAFHTHPHQWFTRKPTHSRCCQYSNSDSGSRCVGLIKIPQVIPALMKPN